MSSLFQCVLEFKIWHQIYYAIGSHAFYDSPMVTLMKRVTFLMTIVVLHVVNGHFRKQITQ